MIFPTVRIFDANPPSRRFLGSCGFISPGNTTSTAREGKLLEVEAIIAKTAPTKARRLFVDTGL